MGKKKKKVWRADPLCIFWTVWKVRNKIAFEDDVLSIQRLKSSFIYFLWSETKLFIKDGPPSLVGSQLDEGGFFGLSTFQGFFCPSWVGGYSYAVSF